MSFDHVFWAVDKANNAARMNGLEGFDDDYMINEGEPVAPNPSNPPEEEYPDNATLHWDRSFPKDTIMTDTLANSNGFMVVSSKTKEFLVDYGVPNVELLPVTVFNHRKRAVKTPYYIVHPVPPIELLDIEACDVEWRGSRVDEAIKQMANFVLDATKVVDLPPIFRLGRISKYVMVHRKLAEAMDAHGLVGNGWIEPKSLEGEWLQPSLPYRRP